MRSSILFIALSVSATSLALPQVSRPACVTDRCFQDVNTAACARLQTTVVFPPTVTVTVAESVSSQYHRAWRRDELEDANKEAGKQVIVSEGDIVFSIGTSDEGKVRRDGNLEEVNDALDEANVIVSEGVLEFSISVNDD